MGCRSESIAQRLHGSPTPQFSYPLPVTGKPALAPIHSQTRLFDNSFNSNAFVCHLCIIMSSTSSASSTGSSGPKPSRFSTFKGFKLSRDKGSKPPPPPPKDSFYLRNRSLASLSPDSPPTPPHSPLFPNTQFLRRPSPNMNQSTISLVSNPASCPPDAPHPISRQREKMSAFFRLRRSPKSPLTKSPPSIEELPSPAKEDENISLPWNFQVRDIHIREYFFPCLFVPQHNIHVDEAYVLLPSHLI